MSRVIIGLAGRIGCGKTMASAELMRFGFVRVPFAGTLKAMLRAIPGITFDHTDGKLKESPCAALGGQTPRYAMQKLGTEWRDMIHRDLWTNAWKAQVQRLPADRGAVADDLRFTHEVEAIHSMGGVVIRIKRDVADNVPVSHASEAFDFDADYDIENNGTIEQFHESLRMMLTGLNAVLAA